MLNHCLRRRPNIIQTLGQHLMFAEIVINLPMFFSVFAGLCLVDPYPTTSKQTWIGCRINVGPASATLVQHWSDIRFMFLLGFFSFLMHSDKCVSVFLLSPRRINNLVENGMIERWKQIYYPRDMCASKESSRVPDPATLQDTQGAFVLLAIGMLLSWLFLLLEQGSIRLRCRSVSIRPGDIRQWFRRRTDFLNHTDLLKQHKARRRHGPVHNVHAGTNGSTSHAATNGTSSQSAVNGITRGTSTGVGTSPRNASTKIRHNGTSSKAGARTPTVSVLVTSGILAVNGVHEKGVVPGVFGPRSRGNVKSWSTGSKCRSMFLGRSQHV